MLKSKKQFFIIAALVIFAYLSVPHTTHAISLVICGNDNQAPCNVQDFLIGVAHLTNWLISVAGLYAAYQIIFAGFNLITAMGDQEKIKSNHQQITNAVVGMVLVLVAYLFIATAVNGILAQGDCHKTINLSDPINYIVAKDNCGK